MRAPRMGRISYLNVLPIYHPLEAGILPHDFELVAAPPAVLNDMMARGELEISSCSCFEYARHPERYYLVRDLSIGSRGPVMSVLLLSSVPIRDLAAGEILISGESHTSVALLRLLLNQKYGIQPRFRVGQVSPELHSSTPPTAFLAIGDEALRLRDHPGYPWKLDLAEAWRGWTGLPFIFGLWVISRNAAKSGLIAGDPGEILRRGRDWGLANLDLILDLTGLSCPLSRQELKVYYEDGLVYHLGEMELEGLRLFYEKLADAGLIGHVPELRFWGDSQLLES